MEKARFNFAWVIAIIVLIAYSYISFMGLVYCQFLPVTLCALLVLVFDALVILLVSVMCKAKHTRWTRLGTIGQVFFGIVVLAMLLASSITFSHFNKIIKQREKIKSIYSSAIVDAQDLSDKYDGYISVRCEQYENSLRQMKAGSVEYNALFSRSLSLQLPKEEIISKCVLKLRNLLKGSNNDADLLLKREQWLQNESASIWNLNLPTNIRDITISVNRWLDNYRELSSISYTGEVDTSPFEDSSFNDNINTLNTICKSIEFPSIWAILLAVISSVLILLPWIVTPKNMASVGGGFDDVVEMPEDDE